MKQIQYTEYFFDPEEQALYRKSKYGQMNKCKPVRRTKDGTDKYRIYFTDRYSVARDYSIEEIILLMENKLNVYVGQNVGPKPSKKLNVIEPYDPAKCRIDYHKKSGTYEPRLHQYSLGHFRNLDLAIRCMQIAEEDYKQGNFHNLEPNNYYKELLIQKIAKENGKHTLKNIF